MSANYFDLQHSEDTRDMIQQAVAALSSGKIIAFPTETVYGLACSALVPEAVERLVEIKGRDPDKPFTFAIRSLDAALDYVPDMSPLARRLARRCWPGPMTLVLDCCHRDSVINRLSPMVRELTTPKGRVGLRVPANEKVLQLMQLCAGPILLTSANVSGQAEARSGREAMEMLGQQIDLVLDDGPSKIGQPSTVLYVSHDSWQVLREGVVDQTALEQLAGYLVLVVCTGNTCRSPMGEALMRKQLATALNCTMDELAQRGVQIVSAGLSAMPGGPAAPQAIEVMREMGLYIEDHQSQPITGRLAQHADLILTMTDTHRRSLVNHWPSLEDRTFTVRTDGGDVSDPIGGPINTYRECAAQVDAEMAKWVERIDFSSIRKQPGNRT